MWELLIIYLIFRIVAGAIKGSIRNTGKNQKKTPNTGYTFKEINLREKNKQNKTRDQGSWPPKNKKSMSFGEALKEIQNQLEGFAQEGKNPAREDSLREQADLEQSRDMRTAASAKHERKIRESRLEADVLVAGDIDSSKFTNKITRMLGKDVLDEYDKSLYGEDKDNPMFDYDFLEPEGFDELEDDVLIGIDGLAESGFKLDIKSAIIASEILGKPISLRKEYE